EDPARLVGDIAVENTEAVAGAFEAGVFAPDVEDEALVRFLGRRQIVRIEDERLAFDVEDASEGALLLATGFGLADVDDVEVAGGDHLRGLRLGDLRILGAIELALGVAELSREV